MRAAVDAAAVGRAVGDGDRVAALQRPAVEHFARDAADVPARLSQPLPLVPPLVVHARHARPVHEGDALRTEADGAPDGLLEHCGWDAARDDIPTEAADAVVERFDGGGGEGALDALRRHDRQVAPRLAPARLLRRVAEHRVGTLGLCVTVSREAALRQHVGGAQLAHLCARRLSDVDALDASRCHGAATAAAAAPLLARLASGGARRRRHRRQWRWRRLRAPKRQRDLWSRCRGLGLDKLEERELTQWRWPVSVVSPTNTWPRCPAQLPHVISMRSVPSSSGLWTTAPA